MSKLKSTIKVNTIPLPGPYKGADNGFVFSDNIKDWQQSRTKTSRRENYIKTK